MFSWTKIPKLVLTASGVKKRGIVWGTLGAVTLLSSIVGPAVWITLGGVASLVTWRLAKKTANWWSYLDLPNSKTSFFQAVLLNIGTHRAAEIVRTNTVQHLKAYFEKTEQGKKVLEEFGLDHEKDLVWEDVLKYETVSVDKNTHKVNIEFWLEDEVSKGPAGGSCKVSSSALINGEGNVTLNEVRLSAPNWHEDEVVPV
ncbi:hypothetical protein BDB01DRAFT_842786 [Pilobolus umbonatus]|nr:hypothetical protein BDB01DRAFT_842786 [Pilobolus umbonatus]